MKVSSIFLAVVLLCTTTALAQETRLGVIAGYNASKVNALGGSGISENRSGFHAGAILELKEDSNWAYEIALMYSEEGEDFKSSTGFVDIKYTAINIPLQIKYYITKGLSVHGGPQVAFLTNVEQTLDNEPATSFEDTVNSSFALTGGLGYDLELGLFVKATFAYGFSDTLVNDAFPGNQRLATAHLSLGYKF